MKKFFVFGVLALLIGSGCTRVEPGYVGIKVNLYGNQRGVDDFPIQTGRVWYNPWTEDIYEFPTFMQSISWTQNDDNGDGYAHNEAITFNSKEGAIVSADISMAYQIEAEKVPHLFIEFRKDIDYITHSYLRPKVRDAFSRHASMMPVMLIFGEQKQDLLKAVREDLEKELGPKGFIFDTISIIGGLHVDADVERAINATIAATQDAIKAENKVKQSEAEARQSVATAEGEARSMLAKAEADAQSITLKAKAQAEGNKLLAESMTPELIQYEMAKKWGGTVPQVVGQQTTTFFPINPYTNESTKTQKNN